LISAEQVEAINRNEKQKIHGFITTLISNPDRQLNLSAGSRSESLQS